VPPSFSSAALGKITNYIARENMITITGMGQSCSQVYSYLSLLPRTTDIITDLGVVADVLTAIIALRTAYIYVQIVKLFISHCWKRVKGDCAITNKSKRTRNDRLMTNTM